MGWRILLLLGEYFLCFSLAALLPLSVPWLDILPSGETEKVRKFNELEFALSEEVSATCVLSVRHMLCRLAAQGEQCEIALEKRAISGSSSLPLLRLMRKKEWQNQYRRPNEYKESLTETGLGKLLGQSAIVYRFDNIQWPVLLRAFDVVIDDKTCISISTKCGLDRWPLVEKDVLKFERSLKRQARSSN